ncbi:MAG TPA: class I SAM-dependent methyltransferase [Williamwhitmania sp.]|nr:class I SAM-dependent methyltransferase [Williamwhitmania sp.]
MSKEDALRVCPVERAGGLDNSVRRWLQNPQKILASYVSDGMTVLDMGCGPGFFSLEMAKMVGESGEVIAVDLQEGMLNKVRHKIAGTQLEKRVALHQCHRDSIGVTNLVDFVLAFYMVHEVPNSDGLFRELRSILKPNGKMLIVEPKFHVSPEAFEVMVSRLESIGLVVLERPRVFFSRSVVLTAR